MKTIHLTSDETGNVIWQHWLDTDYSTDADASCRISDKAEAELRNALNTMLTAQAQYHALLEENTRGAVWT